MAVIIRTSRLDSEVIENPSSHRRFAIIPCTKEHQGGIGASNLPERPPQIRVGPKDFVNESLRHDTSWGFESSKWLDPPLGDISIDRGEGRVLDPVWLLNYGSGTLDIALDKVRNKMYWSEMFNHGDYTTGGLFRMNLEGGTSEYVWEHFPEALALDLIRDKIYWAAFNGIHRADLNGENLENDLISQGSSSIGDLALDIERGKMYWTAWRTVQRADLDGENIEEVLALPEGHPEKIALDVKRGMIYWTNPVTMTIHRADLDGQNAHHLFDLEKDVKRLYLGLRTGRPRR